MKNTFFNATTCLVLIASCGLLCGCRGNQAFQISGGFSRAACSQCMTRSARTATASDSNSMISTQPDRQLSTQELAIQPELDAATTRNLSSTKRNPFGSVVEANPELAQSLQSSQRSAPKLQSFASRQPTLANPQPPTSELEQLPPKPLHSLEGHAQAQTLPTSEGLEPESRLSEIQALPSIAASQDSLLVPNDSTPSIESVGPINELRRQPPETLADWMHEISQNPRDSEATAPEPTQDIVLHAKATIPYQSLRSHRVELLDASLSKPSVPAAPQEAWELVGDRLSDRDLKASNWDFRPLPALSVSQPQSGPEQSAANDQIEFTPLPASNKPGLHANTAIQKSAEPGAISVNVIAPEPDTNPATAARPIQKPTDRR